MTQTKERVASEEVKCNRTNLIVRGWCCVMVFRGPHQQKESRKLNIKETGNFNKYHDKPTGNTRPDKEDRFGEILQRKFIYMAQEQREP